MILKSESWQQNAAELQEDGFTIVRNALDPDYLTLLSDLAERLIDYACLKLENPFEGYYHEHRPQHGVLFDIFQRHPQFWDAVRNEKVLDIVGTVLGPDILHYENTLLFKSTGSANGVPWHQDFIDRPDEPKKIVAWFALDDIRVANGAMSVIPGSHKNGFLPFFKSSGTHHTHVQPQYVDDGSAIVAELNAGDCLIFDQLLLHSSQDVRTGVPRRSFRVSYQGFDEILSPRGLPVVVRGGEPEHLAARFPNKASPQEPQKKMNFGRRVIRRLGRSLANV
jgi:phytanoyl-CoA hydroxylase